MRKLVRPKPNIVIDIRGLSAKQLEKKMNDLEARNYFRDRTIETEGLMLFRHYEPKSVPDLEEVIELVRKVSGKYVAWHKRKGLANQATKAQVEYFVHSNHVTHSDGSPVTSTDLRMIHTNVNLVLKEVHDLGN